MIRSSAGRAHGRAAGDRLRDRGRVKPLGVRIDALPVTPARLRALIREAEARQPAAAE